MRSERKGEFKCIYDIVLVCRVVEIKNEKRWSCSCFCEVAARELRERVSAANDAPV